MTESDGPPLPAAAGACPDCGAPQPTSAVCGKCRQARFRAKALPVAAGIARQIEPASRSGGGAVEVASAAKRFWAACLDTAPTLAAAKAASAELRAWQAEERAAVKAAAAEAEARLAAGPKSAEAMRGLPAAMVLAVDARRRERRAERQRDIARGHLTAAGLDEATEPASAACDVVVAARIAHAADPSDESRAALEAAEAEARRIGSLMESDDGRAVRESIASTISGRRDDDRRRRMPVGGSGASLAKALSLAGSAAKQKSG